jgi:tetratricopeptide (TPR) repeat protein
MRGRIQVVLALVSFAWPSLARADLKVPDAISTSGCAREHAALEKLRDDLPTDDPTVTKHEPRPESEQWEPGEISPSRRAYVETLRQFVQRAQCPAELAHARLRIARIYYEHGHFVEAAIGFREVLEKNRGSDVANYAALLLFDSLSLLRRYDELEAALMRYCAFPEVAKSHQAESMCQELKANLGRRRADSLVRQRHFREAAEMYLRIADQFPRDRRLDELLFLASAQFARAGDRDQALAALRRLLRVKPESSLTKKAREKITEYEGQDGE